MTTAYALPTRDITLTHSDQRLNWLHDGTDAYPGYTEADVLVASGDYFSVLATALDKLAQLLPSTSAERVEMEQMVNTLLYIERHYAIVPRSKLG